MTRYNTTYTWRPINMGNTNPPAYALVAAIAIVLLTSRARGADIAMETTAGSFDFSPEGILTPAASRAMIIIHVNHEQIEQLVRGIWQIVEDTKDTPFRSPPALANRVVKTLQQLNSFNDIHTDNKRHKKDLISWAAGILGIFNIWEGHNLSGRLQHTNEAIRSTLHEVEAVRDFAATNADNIDVLSSAVKHLAKQTDDATIHLFSATLDSQWQTVRAAAIDYMDVVAAALDHSLSPRMVALVSMDQVWGNFSKKIREAGFQSPVQFWQQLFQLQADVRIDHNTISIAVTVAVYKTGTAHYNLFRWVPRPIAIDNTLIDIVDKRTWIAVNRQDGATTAYSKEELDNCDKLGRHRLCRDSTVTYTSRAGSCVQALFRKEWTGVASKCAMTARPMGNEAWPVARNTYLAASADSMQGFLACAGRNEKAIEIAAGLVKISLGDGCRLVTPGWATHHGTNGDRDWLSVEAEQELVGSLFSPTTSNLTTDNKLWKGIKRPTDVASVRQQVEEDLNAGGISGWEIAALTLGGVALLTIMAFVSASYLQARYGRYKPKVKSNEETKTDRQGDSQPSQSGEAEQALV